MSVKKLLNILFSILMENNLIVFSPKFLLETLENILEKNISVKKLFSILFSILMENNMLLVYIHLGIYFHLGSNNVRYAPTCPAICVYIV